VLKATSIIISFSLLILVSSCNQSKNKGQIKLNELASSSIKYSIEDAEVQNNIAINSLRKRVDEQEKDSQYALNHALKVQAAIEKARNQLVTYHKTNAYDRYETKADDAVYNIVSDMLSNVRIIMSENSMPIDEENLPIKQLLREDERSLKIKLSDLKPQEVSEYFSLCNYLMASTQFQLLHELHRRYTFGGSYISDGLRISCKADVVEVGDIFETTIYYGKCNIRKGEVYIGEVDWKRFKEMDDDEGYWYPFEGKLDDLPVSNYTQIENKGFSTYKFKADKVGKNYYEGILRFPSTWPDLYLNYPFKVEFEVFEKCN